MSAVHDEISRRDGIYIEMICEFETDHEFYYDPPIVIACLYNDINPDAKEKVRWRRKISIDLQWVASAAPYKSPDGSFDATEISMCGSPTKFVINQPYGEFMTMWRHPK